MSAQFLGIEIGGTKLQMVVGDATGAITQRFRLTVARDAGATGIRTQIERSLAEILTRTPLAGIGVGFGGPVNWRTGQICCSHQIEGWSEFPLGDWLRGLSKLPVAVDNDANVGTLGEARRGAGVGANPVFYCTLGSGVGGGLVADGRIFHGAQPGEVELGHLRLDRSGAIVESRCSGWAVDQRIRALAQTDPDSQLAKLTAGMNGGEAKHLPAALAAGDAAARRIMDELATDLAFGLSHITHLLHPEVIVLGGGLGLMGDPLRDAVARALPPFVMDAFQPGPRIATAALGEDAIPVGALCMAEQCPCPALADRN